MKHNREREVPLERVVLFTDAVVAIAITLLALDLRLELPENHSLTFHDLLEPWRNYLAFALSFIIIANFWKTHHSIFTYTHKMNETLLAINIGWLFFIVALPFSASVLSSHFNSTPATFLYSLNIFLLSVLQNFMWDYAEVREGFIDREKLSKEEDKKNRTMFNLDMLNGLVAMMVSFFSPLVAFLLLSFKIPTFLIITFYIGNRRRRILAKREAKKDK